MMFFRRMLVFEAVIMPLVFDAVCFRLVVFDAVLHLLAAGFRCCSFSPDGVRRCSFVGCWCFVLFVYRLLVFDAVCLSVTGVWCCSFSAVGVRRGRFLPSAAQYAYECLSE